MAGRRGEIRRRQTRRAHLAALRKRYAAAKTDAERRRVADKLKRVGPGLSLEEFLAPLATKRA